MNKNQKILIVDDDPIVRIILSETLHQEGFKDVLAATNGKEGLETARKEKPDLVVTDIMMPQMDGLHLIQEIHGDPSLAMTPVIVMTSREEMKDLISMVEVQGFIPKPFNRQMMLGAIKKVLADTETAGEVKRTPSDKKGNKKKAAVGAVSPHEKIEKILREGE